ncbi:MULTISPECIES: DUF4097 family beta strand repeat-containing protein [unclassified Amycolatopsis]|uniref:DUF4097 family beta strand repeat-containing protein n=1 Tax=unclassified Amycolatopsis TaxID=2618356 RepID=UPI002874C395|nr:MULTISPECIES: DUF4097 family beta strand repeat-containing protein [unclassified Amycolatopsis]MDS0135014.1 DUF4097 family beta strand repeat protein [Amycolatopsis sp. 505]MDS0148842.1 DUF4097 family beta strand repeat protein [Amycolatopsis sp. CM201R]
MQKFTTPAPITTALAIPAGRVRFVASDDTGTVVQVLPADPAKNRDVKAASEASVSFDDGVLRISLEAKNQYFGPSGALDVTVSLPAGSSVEAKAASVSLRGVGRLGDVTVSGAHGEVVFDEAASLRLTAHAGDVSVGRLTGPAEITTGKGDIRIAEAASGNLVLSTQAGNITVGAAAGVSASLDAGTTYGRIRNALKNEGTPGLAIQATTSYGDIDAHSL